MPLMPAPVNSTISPAMYVLQAENASDPVTDRHHLAGLGDVGLGVERVICFLRTPKFPLGAFPYHAAPFMAYCRRFRRDFSRTIIKPGTDL